MTQDLNKRISSVQYNLLNLPQDITFSTGSTIASTQRYKYNDKEFDEMHGLHWYDYGARHYDPAIMRFTTIDPMCEKYYHLSPYAYCGNNPVNAVDDEGTLTIFINGFHIGWEGGSPSYWHTQNGNFDDLVMAHFNDKNAMYFDGSLGGALGLNRNILPIYREAVGQMRGIIEAEGIISNLKRDNNGNIIEPIRIVSHSMGGSYAKGLARAILNYALKHKDETNGLSITEYDFAPFKPTFQSAVKGVDTYQYSHRNDWVAGNKRMFGSKFMKTSDNEDKGHSIGDFIDYIMTLPQGHYVIENGMITNKGN